MTTSAIIGIVLIFSFMGWGILFQKASQSKEEWRSGLNFLVGVSTVAFLGGILNLASLVSETTNRVVVALGLLAYGVTLRCSSSKLRSIVLSTSQAVRRHPLSTLAAVPFLVSIAIVYLSYCKGWFFNSTDDYNGYFVYPLKMLQTGSMGSDPFSQRRFSGLGANSYLQSIALSFVSLQRVSLIEPALILIMLPVLIYGMLAKAGGSRMWTVATLPFLLAIAVHAPRANSSNVVLGLALLIALLHFYFDSRDRALTLSRCLSISLISACVCSLKGNLASFPPISLSIFFGSRVLEAFFKKRPVMHELKYAGLSALLFLSFLAPWLISAYPSIGSWYYPLLGKGYTVTSYHDVEGLLKIHADYPHFFFAAVDSLRYPGLLAALILFVGLAASTARKEIQLLLAVWLGTVYFTMTQSYLKALLICLISGCAFSLFFIVKNRHKPLTQLLFYAGGQLGAVWIAAVGMYLAVAGCCYQRFQFSQAYACLIAFLVLTGVYLREKPSRLLAVLLGVVSFAIAFQEVTFDGIPSNLLTSPNLFINRMSEHARVVFSLPSNQGAMTLPEPRTPGIYASLQESIPQGKTVLARVLTPYLLDFRKHNIWVADVPGEVSPPPGMPYKAGPDALARYLENLGVCYVAFSYGSPEIRSGHLAQIDHFYSWIRAESQLTEDFQQNLMALSKLKPSVFDDGKSFVLKLCSK